MNILRNCTLWDITQCSPLKANQHFGVICRHHIENLRGNQEINQQEAGSKESQSYPSILKK
jgi:hypothetical protein